MCVNLRPQISCMFLFFLERWGIIRVLNSYKFLWQVCMGVQSLSCVWLWDSMVCSPPASSVRGIFQAGVLEQVAISYSRGSPPPRDRACVSCIGRRALCHCATWEAPSLTGMWSQKVKMLQAPRSKSLLLVTNSTGHSGAVAMQFGSFRDGGERIGEGHFIFIYYWPRCFFR